MFSGEVCGDGESLRVAPVGQGDTEHSTFLHIPSLDAVVADDVCYNHVHMMLFEAGEQQREAWIASLDAIAAPIAEDRRRRPQTGRCAGWTENIAASQQYLRDFTRVANEIDSAQAIVEGMLALHGGRVQPHTLYLSANAEIARRG